MLFLEQFGGDTNMLQKSLEMQIFPHCVKRVDANNKNRSFLI